MATITPDYRLAAGHDNPGGLTRLDELSDGDGVRFVMPRGLPYRNRGQRRFRTDGSVARIGHDQTQWLFQVMTIAQYRYMLDNYEGLVTIRHPLSQTTFANYNAALWWPDEIELDYAWLNGSVYDAGFTGPGYRAVVGTLNKLEAI